MAVQLGLAFAVARLFDVEESSGFNRITPIVFVGFLVHAVAPKAWRKPIFLVVFLVALQAILPVRTGVFVVLVGLALIGICHLRLAIGIRVGLLIAAAAVLALLRDEMASAIPLLGAIFMFRLVVYLYDLPHIKQPVSIWDRLSYFFLLPNICFLLFPVVDFRTYLRTWYDKPDTEIYQKGVLWIFRGITHLLMYRVVYYYMMPVPSEVDGLFRVLQYMLATYLLYLRISGQFHMIVGIICLFGYNLPETHHLYYLASSFNDYWRRINIYWKDFMMKIFFYPSFMRLRRFGMTPALIAATLIVFAGTWLLHSYQWFWLQGSFPLTWPDAIFWGTLGVLVAINTVVESRGGKRLKSAATNWSLIAAIRYALRVLGMFLLIMTLWSLWSSPSVGEFVDMARVALSDSLATWALLGLVLIGVVALGVLAQFIRSRGFELTVTGSSPSFRRSAFYTLLGSLALVSVGLPSVSRHFSPATSELVSNLKSRHLNERDATMMDRGYYEGLLVANPYTSAISGVQARKPRNWKALMETDAVRPTDGVLQYVLEPNLATVLKGAPFETNALGLRDKEYSLEKPIGTLRIALVGASYEMGAGVTRDETFEAIAEARLNRENALGRDVEILNHSVGGYGVVHYVELLRGQSVWATQPDAIMLALHTTESTRLVTHLGKLTQSGLALDEYPVVDQAIGQSGAQSEMSTGTLHAILEPYADDVIAWAIREIADIGRARNVPIFAMWVPLSSEIDGPDQERYDTITGFARDSGIRVIDLQSAFEGATEDEVRLAPWDDHLGPLGNKLVADELYERLVANSDLFPDHPTASKSNGS